MNSLISVIIPLYNEEESISELADSVKNAFSKLNYDYEIIFVDDGSTDKSYEIIKDINVRDNKVHCIKFRRNYGKSAALAAGFKKAKGDIVITMDADLQDDPEEIPELIEKINSGYDLVSGWKKIRHDPFIKKHTSKFFNFSTSVISGVRLHDFNCGLKAYKKDVIKSVQIYGELHRFIPAMAHLSGFKVTEKIVKHHPRKYGKTKFGFSRFLNGFFDMLTVYFTSKFIRRPLHLFGFAGLVFLLLGLIITLYLTYLKIFLDSYISNRPLLFAGVLSIIVGIQFFSLGLLGEMITRTRPPEDDISIETEF